MTMAKQVVKRKMNKFEIAEKLAELDYKIATARRQLYNYFIKDYESKSNKENPIKIKKHG